MISLFNFIFSIGIIVFLIVLCFVLQQDLKILSLLLSHIHKTTYTTGSIYDLPQENVSVTKESDFPSDWLTSEHLFALEKRAIFSKSWHYCAHVSQLPSPGTYISLIIAGFPIFLIKGKDSVIRSFHNVCRHRAYTVTKKPTGSSLVLGCRYHGWSYDTLGRLVKAPQFENITGFDKAKNGLWEVKTSVDGAGRVWVNLDSTDSAEAQNTDPAVAVADLGALLLVDSWTTESSMNWKYTVGNMSNIQVPQYGLYRFLKGLIVDQTVAWQQLSISTFACRLSSSSWLMASIIPLSAEKTAIKFDILARNKSSVGTYAIEGIKGAMDRVITAMETHYDPLVVISFKTHDAASVIAQEEALQKVKAHMKLEQLQGSEIHPVAMQTQATCRGKAELLCSELDKLGHSTNRIGCPSNAGNPVKGILDW